MAWTPSSAWWDDALNETNEGAGPMAKISDHAWSGDGDSDGEQDTVFRRNDDGSTEIDRFFGGEWHTYHSPAPEDEAEED
jgi:hypothetical protein